MKAYNFLFCADENYLKFAAVLMTSIVLASKCKNNEISSALNPAKRAGGGH